ncbi:MAG: 3TM-type holin [Thermodesulfovibrio sp.]|nr:3TM-type holin [Thermodesulfovibrio sp.]
MSIIGIGEVIKVIGNIADDLITTDKERLELSLKEKELALKDKELDIAVLSKVHETNIAEAGHRSIFVAGWRPAIGWICAISLAYSYIIHPLFLWINSIFKLTESPPPILSNEMLMTIIFGMLGLGAMRSFEKFKGVSR